MMQKRLEQLAKEVIDVVKSSQQHLTRDQIIDELVEMHSAAFAVPASESALFAFRRQVASTLRDLVVRNTVQRYQLHGGEVYSVQTPQQPQVIQQPSRGEVYRQQ